MLIPFIVHPVERLSTTSSFVVPDEFDLSDVRQPVRKLMAWVILRLGGKRRRAVGETVETLTIDLKDRRLRECVHHSARAAQSWDRSRPAVLLMGHDEFNKLGYEARDGFSCRFSIFCGMRIVVVPGMQGILVLSEVVLNTINDNDDGVQT